MAAQQGRSGEVEAVLGGEGCAGAKEVTVVSRAAVAAHVCVRGRVDLPQHLLAGVCSPDVGCSAALEGGAGQAEAALRLGPEDLRTGVSAEDGLDEVRVATMRCSSRASSLGTDDEASMMCATARDDKKRDGDARDNR